MLRLRPRDRYVALCHATSCYVTLCHATLRYVTSCDTVPPIRLLFFYDHKLELRTLYYVYFTIILSQNNMNLSRDYQKYSEARDKLKINALIKLLSHTRLIVVSLYTIYFNCNNYIQYN